MKKLVSYLPVVFVFIVLGAIIFLKPEKTPTLSPQEQELIEKVQFDTNIALLLKKETGSTIQQLEGYDSQNDDYVNVQGVKLKVSEKITLPIVQKLRKELLGKGYLIFVSEENVEGENAIGVLKTSDQFEILRIMGTNGANYDLTTNDIIAKVQGWDNDYGFEILGAGMDFIEGRLGKTPDEIPAFAKEIYAFCPDIVDQGVGTVEKLEQLIQQDLFLFCWWD